MTEEGSHNDYCIIGGCGCSSCCEENQKIEDCSTNDHDKQSNEYKHNIQGAFGRVRIFAHIYMDSSAKW